MICATNVGPRRQVITSRAGLAESTAPSVARVMVVEDDHALNFAMRLRLEASGYDTLHAYNAAEAVGLLRSARPDLVLLDVGLPDVDGLSLVRSFAAPSLAMQVPVLLVTGDTSPRTAEYAADAGIQQVLYKPVRQGILLRHVRRLLGQER